MKRLLFLALMIWPVAASAQQTTFTVVCVGTAATDTAKFEAIKTIVGATNPATIKIPYKLNTARRCKVNNLTITANITLDNSDGSGVFVVTGQTLTIAGSVVGPPRQFFFNATVGLGTVSFSGSKTTRQIFPEWWGAVADGSTDCSAALQAAVTALTTISGGDVLFSNGNYKLLSTITVGATTGGGDALGAFTSINLKGQGVTNTFITWAGATTGTMLKFWRNKYAIISQIKFQNSVAKGTTIGLHLTGPAAGTQSLNLNFINCDFALFDTGLKAGAGVIGTEAASELHFLLCNFTQNNTGFLGAGTGNTLNVWLDKCGFFSNTISGANFGTAGAVHVYGGASNANGASTFELVGSWQGAVEVSNFRFELTPPEVAIRGGSPDTLLVKACQFVTTSTVPTYPVVQTSAQVTLESNMFGVSGNVGWITAEVTTGGNVWFTLSMIENSIRGTSPFYVAAATDRLNYSLQGNAVWGGTPTHFNERGQVFGLNRVPDEIRGTATFATAATKTVTITTRENANYDVFIEKAVNEDIWITGKTASQFVLNSSNATSTAVINYVIRRQAQ